MKQLILILALVVCVQNVPAQKNYIHIQDANYFIHSYGDPVTSSSEGFPLWNSYQTSTTNQITSVQFISYMGWASHIGMGLVLTSNGGYNWTSVSFNDTTFTTTYNGVYFINQFTGWTVGGALQIRKTTNRGVNWVRQVPPPIAGVLNSVYFFDANTGFAIGRQGMYYNSCIIKTTNGGVNWTEVIVSTSAENELSGQYWFNSSTGWICGKNFLMKTTNGGANFINYFTGIPPTSNNANALLCINFQNPLTGWIGASNLDKKNIYKTTNGGLNWFFQDNPVAQYTYVQINDILFTDPDWGYAAHGTPYTGAILFTTNGGINWTLDEGTNTWFDCLNSYNDAIVYCGAGAGKVWYCPIPSGVSGTGTEEPDKFRLHQNYPNPFNPSSVIKFEIPKTSGVRISVYDIMGNEVKTLVNSRLKAGVYETAINGSGLASGVYIYALFADGIKMDSRKMILIK